MFRRRFLSWLICAGCALLPVIRSHGQARGGFLGDAPPPPLPAFNVQDHASLFSRNQAGLKAIADRLQALEQRHRYRIYVVIESVVMGSNPIDLSARLQQAWLPEGDGLVIVYEVDSRSFGIGRPFESADPGRASDVAQIPSFITSDIVLSVHQQLEEEQKGGALDNQALLDRLTSLLAQKCEDYFARSHAPEPPGTTFRWVAASAGVISVAALAGLLAVRWTRSRDRWRSRSFRFTPVPDQQRLGAPFGAKVSARRFGGSDPAEGA